MTRQYFLLLLFAGISTHTYSQKIFTEVDKALTALNKEGAFSGSVLVARKGVIIYQKNIGFADIEHNIPINRNTKFELASVSKIFTAILILQLVESGKIKVEAKVSDYIPEFTRKDSGEITIHHLLSHTSGIQDFVGLNCPFAGWTEKEFMEGLRVTPLNFKPGAKFEYASSTYILLRFIIERVTGVSYEENLKEHIFKIAGMPASGVIHDNDILPDRAAGYINTDSVYKNALPVLNHYIFTGAASVYSTAADLLRFDQALYTNKLLGKKEKEQMFSVVQPPYGYGWFIDQENKQGKVVSHGGDIFGYTTLIERRLKGQTLVIVLSNLQSADRGRIVSIIDKTLL